MEHTVLNKSPVVAQQTFLTSQNTLNGQNISSSQITKTGLTTLTTNRPSVQTPFAGKKFIIKPLPKQKIPIILKISPEIKGNLPLIQKQNATGQNISSSLIIRTGLNSIPAVRKSKLTDKQNSTDSIPGHPLQIVSTNLSTIDQKVLLIPQNRVSEENSYCSPILECDFTVNTENKISTPFTSVDKQNNMKVKFVRTLQKVSFPTKTVEKRIIISTPTSSVKKQKCIKPLLVHTSQTASSLLVPTSSITVQNAKKCENLTSTITDTVVLSTANKMSTPTNSAEKQITTQPVYDPTSQNNSAESVNSYSTVENDIEAAQINVTSNNTGSDRTLGKAKRIPMPNTSVKKFKSGNPVLIKIVQSDSTQLANIISSASVRNTEPVQKNVNSAITEAALNLNSTNRMSTHSASAKKWNSTKSMSASAPQTYFTPRNTVAMENKFTSPSIEPALSPKRAKSLSTSVGSSNEQHSAKAVSTTTAQTDLTQLLVAVPQTFCTSKNTVSVQNKFIQPITAQYSQIDSSQSSAGTSQNTIGFQIDPTSKAHTSRIYIPDACVTKQNCAKPLLDQNSQSESNQVKTNRACSLGKVAGLTTTTLQNTKVTQNFSSPIIEADLGLTRVNMMSSQTGVINKENSSKLIIAPPSQIASSQSCTATSKNITTLQNKSNTQTIEPGWTLTTANELTKSTACTSKQNCATAVLDQNSHSDSCQNKPNSACSLGEVTVLTAIHKKASAMKQNYVKGRSAQTPQHVCTRVNRKRTSKQNLTKQLPLQNISTRTVQTSFDMLIAETGLALPQRNRFSKHNTADNKQKHAKVVSSQGSWKISDKLSAPTLQNTEVKQNFSSQIIEADLSLTRVNTMSSPTAVIKKENSSKQIYAPPSQIASFRSCTATSQNTTILPNKSNNQTIETDWTPTTANELTKSTGCTSKQNCATAVLDLNSQPDSCQNKPNSPCSLGEVAVLTAIHKKASAMKQNYVKGRSAQTPQHVCNRVNRKRTSKQNPTKQLPSQNISTRTVRTSFDTLFAETDLALHMRNRLSKRNTAANKQKHFKVMSSQGLWKISDQLYAPTLQNTKVTQNFSSPIIEEDLGLTRVNTMSSPTAVINKENSSKLIYAPPSQIDSFRSCTTTSQNTTTLQNKSNNQTIETGWTLTTAHELTKSTACTSKQNCAKPVLDQNSHSDSTQVKPNIICSSGEVAGLTATTLQDTKPILNFSSPIVEADLSLTRANKLSSPTAVIKKENSAKLIYAPPSQIASSRSCTATSQNTRTLQNKSNTQIIEAGWNLTSANKMSCRTHTACVTIQNSSNPNFAQNLLTTCAQVNRIRNWFKQNSCTSFYGKAGPLMTSITTYSPSTYSAHLYHPIPTPAQNLCSLSPPHHHVNESLQRLSKLISRKKSLNEKFKVSQEKLKKICLLMQEQLDSDIEIGVMIGNYDLKYQQDLEERKLIRRQREEEKTLRRRLKEEARALRRIQKEEKRQQRGLTTNLENKDQRVPNTGKDIPTKLRKV